MAYWSAVTDPRLSPKPIPLQTSLCICQYPSLPKSRPRASFPWRYFFSKLCRLFLRILYTCLRGQK